MGFIRAEVEGGDLKAAAPDLVVQKGNAGV